MKKKEYFIPIVGDINNYKDMEKIIKKIKPQIVIHLAGLTSVFESFSKPIKYYRVNTLSTIKLAEINRKYNPNLEKFIWPSSCYEYGIQHSFPIKENAPLNPIDPYSCSKASATKYLIYMYHTYNFPVIISRSANIFGRKKGKFQKLGVIENIITQMIKENKIFLGSPKPVRDFLYIDDLIEWYKLLIKKGRIGRTYNVGSGKGYSIKEVVDLAKKITKSNSEIYWNVIPERPIEIPKIVLNIRSAKKLGWKPKYSLKQGLIKVKEWVKFCKNCRMEFFDSLPIKERMRSWKDELKEIIDDAMEEMGENLFGYAGI
jgi:UDP-glucose 4-epimerase